MFRLISGSSSITRIFLISFSKNRQPDRDRGAFSKFADQLNAASMEFDTTLYHEQAKSGARTRTHIVPAMESLEQMLVIFHGNANSLVAKGAYRVRPVPLNREPHGRSGLGVFHRVAEKICENVPEQPFIRLRFQRNRARRQFDQTPSVDRRENLIDHAPAKTVQVED